MDAFAEKRSMLLLHVEELLQLVIADVIPTYQVVAQELGGILRRRCHHEPVTKVDLLVVGITLDGQRPGLAALGNPLQQIGERHRPEVAADRHSTTLSGGVLNVSPTGLGPKLLKDLQLT